MNVLDHRRLLQAALVVPALSLIFAATPAGAATFQVTKTADTLDGACDSDCSLREAVQAANLDATADTIVLPAGTFRLDRPGVDGSNTNGDLDVAEPVTIQGAGPNLTTIQNFVDDRVVDISGAGSNVNLIDLSVAGGKVDTAEYEGGGIRLTTGSLSLMRVVVRDNLAWGSAALGMGGGIYDVSGQLVITDSAIVNNQGTAPGFGGGIFIATTSASAQLTNVTIAGNSAVHGGGIFSNAAVPVTMSYVTITNNQAAGEGGGTDGDTSLFRLRSSVIAGNTSPTAPNCVTPGAPASDGGNVGDAACGFTLPSDAQTLDARLGIVGGATIPVAEPLADSPALDRAVGTCPAADARGVSRPQGAACDAGAAERPVARDITAPVGSALKLKPRKFAAASKGASIAASKRLKRGTRVSFNLSEAATVTFTVQRPVQGRKVGKNCKRQTRANRTHKSCTLFLTLKGSFSQAGRANANGFRFTGRLARRALHSGNYRLAGTPVDAAGNKGRSFVAKFTIVKP